jgi:hypothetical protein
MFSYIEQGDMRNLAIQGGMQSAMFGLVTLPGFEQITNLANSISGGDRKSPKDALLQNNESFRGFGADLSDLLAHGTLSNLPKLFGAEGIDLYSRGDTQARSPVFEGLSTMPAVSVISKGYEGATAIMSMVGNAVGDSLGLFQSKYPKLTMGQVGEVLSNTIPNRPIAGMVEQLLAGGNDTDSYSQLVSETLSDMETVYRVMGMRSMRQSKDVDAYYQSKEMQTTKAAHDEVLRESSRALMREGKFDSLPDIFETYVENGNDPSHFKRWYKDNLESATDTRSQRLLQEAMKSEKMTDVVDRLTAGEVTMSEEEEAEDPMESMMVADPMDDPTAPTPDESDPGLMWGL